MAESSTGSIGTVLREAREQRGLSLRQVANATKISIHALEALEQNDVSHLPGGIFTRAFVRSYAGAVGLDPEKILHEFIAQFPTESVTAGHPAAPPLEDNLSIESARRTALSFLTMILFSVPIAGALLYFGTPSRPAPISAPPAPASASPASAAVPETTPPSPALPSALPASSQTTPTRRTEIPPAPQPGQTVPAQSTTSPVPEATTGSTREAPAVPDRLTVSLSATGPSWISAIADGQHVIERLFAPGDRQVLEVRSDLVLTAGDPSTLVVTINGVETKSLGSPGEVVTRRFTRDNFREYLISP